MLNNINTVSIVSLIKFMKSATIYDELPATELQFIAA